MADEEFDVNEYGNYSPAKKLRFQAWVAGRQAEKVRVVAAFLDALAKGGDRDLGVAAHSLINHYAWFRSLGAQLTRIADELEPTDWVQFAKDYVAGDIDKHIPEHLRGDPDGV